MDKTDPFITVEGDLTEKTIYETEVAKLQRLSPRDTELVKWTAKEKFKENAGWLDEILMAGVRCFDWVEDLLLDEKGFTADGFTGTLRGQVRDLSLAEMLDVLSDTFRLEARIWEHTKTGFQNPDTEKIYLKDINPTSLSGYRFHKLRFYSLEDLQHLESASHDLTLQIAEILRDELSCRVQTASPFKENVEKCLTLVDGILRNPDGAGDLLSRASVKLEVANLTHVGRVRSNNEDALLVERSALLEMGRSYTLLAVADGMGGHAGGEVASTLALELLRCYAPAWALAVQCKEDIRELAQLMREHIKMVNQEVLGVSERAPDLQGMGTTLTGVFACHRGDACEKAGLRSFSMEVFNVGDSRTFKVGFRGYAPLTRDHSLVQELVDAGKITEDEAFQHPQKNIVSQAIGTGNEVKPDVFTLSLPLDSFIVIASDGLTDLVHPTKLEELASEAKTPDELTEAYLSSALNRGGTDNVTMIAIKPVLLTD